MIEIVRLRAYFETDDVFVTEHAAERFHQRGIKTSDIRNAVNTGRIIEQYPGSFPFPSCLVLGQDMAGRVIHVCMSDEGSSSRIITAYYPDPNRWSVDLDTRKER